MLATHGPSGKDIIGTKIDPEDMDTWRDDPESIEPSSGSAVSSTIQLDGETTGEGEGLEISKWRRHPSQNNIMLCGLNTRKGEYYYCHAFDHEAGGKLTTRYLGHGGSVDGFSASVNADPNVFLTWCSDGHARLYDVRHPLPVLTIASAKHLEPMPAAVLAHPDGIPYRSLIFTGTARSKCINLWDVRSRAMLYELATGNNCVEALAWDETSNSLYAATSCPHIDWNGRHLDYRPARIPKVRTGEDEDGEGDSEDNAEEDDIEEPSDDICWPKGAHHAEDHFGHVFDAGDHRLYKFKFKMDPDPNQLPYYGSASLSTGFW
ncbi:unnamed protein product [Cyclocybe aegerita]|uniref:Uncharacterized protein n=1 Tax=Cyclocybe aegerita TaxID=1973307 RepID=A0A8S0VS15_CYCAE|nr:unnamed protein product [Cyclocybe aegerita]